MTSTSASDPGPGGTAGVTQDAFLGGRLTLFQPARGYRAGVDPMLLAAAIPARPGQSVLELGCGVGAALFCLAARVPQLALTGVELQPDYADLARRNATANGIPARIVAGDLRTLPGDLRARGFDHVIANPPYFDRRRGTASDRTGRETALGGDTPLRDWLDVATRRLSPKGYLTLIQKADRLPDILAAMDDRLGSLVVRPIAGRAGRDADRVLILARKEGRARLRLLAPLILHDGCAHGADAEDYTAEVRAVLRDGAALPMIG